MQLFKVLIERISVHYQLTRVIETVNNYEKPISVGIPDKEVDITSVKYAAKRLNTDVKFTDEALKMLVKVPRPFLKLVLQGCVDWANKNNVKLITEKEMKIINDKRSKEKNRG